ncbi:hypothetical protein [Maricaulis maris]|uniref:Uncharacterized protein n=1 Tax=Maricaulis maris TaxID=74318 RepID=A0A495DFW9_9PROT|nr:hypothetical protein [Maricaulis maris]RKR00436.1 hypothetical protein C7435_1644 [Maricaulis maris]
MGKLRQFSKQVLPYALMLFLSIRWIWDEDATRFQLVFAGAASAMLAYIVLNAAIDVFGQERLGRAGRAVKRATQLSVVTAFFAAAAVGVYLFGAMTVEAGWYGLALTTAILIPVTTITIVLGGHKPILDWFNSLRRKT